MAGNTAILAVRVIADAADATRGLDETAGAARRWERSMAAASTAATAAIGGIALLGKTAFDAASAQQQAFGAVESVYGDAADRVRELADAAGSSVGLAASEYAQFASVLGSQLRNLGVAEEDLISTQDGLIRTAADLAATFGGSTSQAVEALSSLFRGETDPIEQYGISIKQADVNARLAAQGLADLEGDARRTAETQARLALVTEQSGAAQGAFAREANTAAGAQQRANAAWQNAAAALGTALLPIVVEVSGFITQLSGWVQENTNVTIAATAAIGTLAVTFKVLNAVMRANPIALVISLVVTLTTMVITAYRQSDRFREIVDRAGRIAVAAFDAISGPVGAVIDIIRSLIGWVRSQSDNFRSARRIAVAAIGAIVAPIRDVIDWVAELAGAVASDSRVATAFRTIGDIASGIWNGVEAAIEGAGAAVDAVVDAIEWALDRVDSLTAGISAIPSIPGIPGLGIFSMSAFAPSLSHAPAAGAAGPAAVTINISGALDADSVARQVDQLLSARGIRTGAAAGFGAL